MKTAPYRSDRNEARLKIKSVQKGKFPVSASSKILWRRRFSTSASGKGRT
jgi:hypothetical protein